MSLIEKLIELLNKLNIPVKLYKLFGENDETNIKSLKEIIDISDIHIENNNVCNILNDTNIQKFTQAGQGAVNRVYDIKNGYIIRATINPINFDLFKIKKITTETDKNRLILSDALYDIVINSIISKNLDNNPNFTKYLGSFYCNNTQKMYSIMEKNNMSLLKFFPNNIHLLSKELLYNLTFQYSCVCYQLWKNGIIDFDRHLDNIMIRYVNDNYLNKLRKKFPNIKAFDKDINIYKDEQNKIELTPFNDNEKKIYNSEEHIDYHIIGGLHNKKFSIVNYGIYVVPIDFGISIYKNKNEIYNESSSYDVTTASNVCLSGLSFNYYDNIRAKYAVLNERIHPNVMFFFFLKNLIKVLNIVIEHIKNLNKNIFEQKIFDEVKGFIKDMTTIFNFNNYCLNTGNIGDNCENKPLYNIMGEKGDMKDYNVSAPFYLYRNIGIPNYRIEDIISELYKKCPEKIKKSRTTPMIPRETPTISRETPMIPRETPTISRETPTIQMEDENIFEEMFKKFKLI
jgi:hypothetical protein